MFNSGFCMCVCLFIIGNVNTSQGYKYVRLQDYLCADKFFITLQKPFRGNPKVTLTDERHSAAIITQTWNTTLPGFYTSNKLKYDCTFSVQTNEKPLRGIYTIITRLKFRTDPEKNNSCLDYIQFSGGNRSPSKKICSDISPKGSSSRYFWDQRSREVNVHIHIDNHRMISEPLELQMVLTAHSECLHPSDFKCNPNQTDSCIWRYFERDDVVNCMYPCRDEVSCFIEPVAVKETDIITVAFTALTALIFTMLGVVFFVWVCWKYWNCITVQQQARETAAQRRRMDIPTNNSPNVVNLEEPISQNAYDQQQNPRYEQPPKDLPPSYDELFPDR
ncbi:uncharacterized protein LOC119684793 [Teleopsis dalmanni]|uniref:uncharacterized protein LOC119684342 n=1 Tax=Teleopsis dalmanni TaxID=139649 RepID=UPI0018CFDD71|nr:uncharacterized protein LOC119684342 [Teleopsis dalmanni]XP_037954844.1 uncharacterized protein LOC119684793 [Teleopsis dalmanni]